LHIDGGWTGGLRDRKLIQRQITPHADPKLPIPQSKAVTVAGNPQTVATADLQVGQKIDNFNFGC
jgi:hypothetical protein